MAYYAYVIYSPAYERYYKGHCGELKSRLRWHNSGKTKATKPYRPWKLIYYEEFGTRQEAIEREVYFKTAAGRRYLKEQMDKGNRGSPPERLNC